jgi:hypothetical protein
MKLGPVSHALDHIEVAINNQLLLMLAQMQYKKYLRRGACRNKYSGCVRVSELISL